jgi:protein sidekick
MPYCLLKLGKRILNIFYVSTAPSQGVSGVRVVPITTTSVEVHWQPIPAAYWSGDHQTGGYRIMFQPVSDFPTSLQATPKQEVQGIEVGTFLYIVH